MLLTYYPVGRADKIYLAEKRQGADKEDGTNGKRRQEQGVADEEGVAKAWKMCGRGVVEAWPG